MKSKISNLKSKALDKINDQKAKYKERSGKKKMELAKCTRMLDRPLINAKKIGFFMAGGMLSSAATGLAQPNGGHINQGRAQGTALASIIMGAVIQNLTKSNNAKTFGQGLMAAGAFKLIENKT